MQADEIIRKIAELCHKYSAKEAVLFGSRAKGTALEQSDFDILQQYIIIRGYKNIWKENI